MSQRDVGRVDSEAERTREVKAALEVWKKGLLTVSGASRLINYRPTKTRSLTVETPSSDEILAHLMVGSQLRFQGRREEDAEQPLGEPRVSVDQEVPIVHTARPDKEIGPLLRSIMRYAANEWLDRGLHTLYLACGMLHWQDVDNTVYASPLILIPVELVPLGPRDVPRLAPAEDDPLVNPTLRVTLEKLGVSLPALEEGTAIETHLVAIEESIASKPSWRVTRDQVLSLFSFHKEAMYKDLVENEATILKHPVVRALATSDPLKQTGELSYEPISPDEIDRVAPPEDTPIVLDADSSQRAAIAAALDGRSFVMDGPPGTGKSQTIANMIGALMHAGKTVLFVSEKAAALEVVRNRLEHVGLLPYLFELHSNKASRKEVSEELLNSLLSKPVPGLGMPDHDRGVAAKDREALTAFADAMNETRKPLGQSLHTVLGRLSVLDGAPRLPMPDPAVAVALTNERYAELRDTLHELPWKWRPAEQGSTFLWLDVTDRKPLMERVDEAIHRLDQLFSIMSASPQLTSAFQITGPSGAGRLQRFQQLVEEASAPTPDAWLLEADLSGIEDDASTLRADIESARRATAKWHDATGQPWAVTHLFDEASPVGAALASGFVDDGATGPQCSELAVQLVAWADHLDATARDGGHLASVLGLPPVETMLDIDRTLDLAELCASPHKPESSWFGFQGGPSEVDRALTDAEIAMTALASAESKARQHFNPAALTLSLPQLLDRFRNQHRGLGKLSSAYRQDKQTLQACLTEGTPIAVGIAQLEQAVAWQAAAAHFEEVSRTVGPWLGAHWTGMQTDLSAAKSAAAVAARAESLMGRTPLPSQLVDRLVGPELGVASTASQIRADLAHVRSALAPDSLLGRHPQLHLSPVDVASQEIRSNASKLSAAAQWLAQIDHFVGGTTSLTRADLLRSIWTETAAALAKLPESDHHLHERFGSLYAGIQTDISLMDQALGWTKQVRSMAGSPLSQEQVDALRHARPVPALAEARDRWDRAIGAVLSAFGQRRQRDLEAELHDFDTARELLDALKDDPDGQEEWFAYRRLRQELVDYGLDEAVRASLEARVPRDDVPAALEKALLRAWVGEVMRDQRLDPSTTDGKNAQLTRYRKLDEELIRSAHSRIIHAVNGRRPPFNGLGEQGVIRREGEKRRRHMNVRELIGKTTNTVMALKPCFLMSPLAVSQYLPPDIRFDVVIFDEASQVTPSDAVTCVYRGHALILAGDDKQLPPTAFFERMDDDEAGDEETDVKDFASVLELGRASGALRNQGLRWHYRSADDALISFSNYKFYGGKLVVFPSPGDRRGQPAIQFHHVEGVYRRGATRDNPLEAQAVAERVLQHFTDNPGETLGVVTFSVPQQQAVLDALDRAREQRRDLDQYFDVNERLDAFFVKSLESVQGDERDKIIFSIGYGPDENGKITTNFGVLNRDKGWRRLNVAVTRARQRIELVSSMRAGDIPPTTNENVEYLRAYLDYAARGMAALAIDLGASGGTPDSPFEESVLALLNDWGYTVESQVGSAGYRVDIGVRHPDFPGLFMLGIECDGYQYHSAPAARDRDRLRESVLRGLGWRIHRIWGTAWYRDRVGEEARLRQALDEAIRSQHSDAPASARPAVSLEFEAVAMLERPSWAVEYSEARVPALPHWIDVSAPGAGFDMVDAVRHVVEVEGPVHEKVLHERLRVAWGIGAIGSRIRQNVNSAIRNAGVRHQGEFVSMANAPVQVRTPSATTTRKAEHIHEDELSLAMTLLLADMGSAEEEQLLIATARLFGWGRTGSGIQGRLRPILMRLLQEGAVRRSNGVVVVTG